MSSVDEATLSGFEILLFLMLFNLFPLLPDLLFLYLIAMPKDSECEILVL